MQIGLIVGIGPAAADHYYRLLIAAFASRNLPLELTMAHADLPTLQRNAAARDAGAQALVYARLSARLQAAGAGCVAVTSVGGHFCIAEFKRISPLPVLDILDALPPAVAARGLRRVGILGTRLAMESRLYGVLGSTEVLAPNEPQRSSVHEAYVAMASAGVVTQAQRALFFEAGRTLVEECGVEAVLLAGTDLPLAFAGQVCGFPVVDCAALHVEAIVAAATP